MLFRSARYLTTCVRGIVKFSSVRRDKTLTAFRTLFWSDQYTVMPFELKGASATFQCLRVGGGGGGQAGVFLEDIITFSERRIILSSIKKFSNESRMMA